MENHDLLDNQAPAMDSSNQLTTETIDKLGSLATWINAAAIMAIAGQALTLIIAIVTKQISQIVGIAIGVVLAIILLNAAKALRQYYNQEDPPSFELFSKTIRTYFMVSGILFIVGISLALIAAIFMFAMMGTLMR